jgi:hypothetical protein
LVVSKGFQSIHAPHIGPRTAVFKSKLFPSRRPQG